jgi:hypothetical protein
MKFFNKHDACATDAYAHQAETDWEATYCDVKRTTFPNSFKTRKTFGTEHPQTTKYAYSGPRVEKRCSKS